MKSAIITPQPPQPPPPERVILDLSVAEFAVLYLLMYRHLGGSNPLRRRIDDGMCLARRKLNDENKAKVSKCCESTGRHEYAAAAVAAVFGHKVEDDA